MDKIIDNAIAQVADGSLDFPGFIRLLATAGVDCYTVNLASHKVVYYAGVKCVNRRFQSDDLDIAPRFNETILRSAIIAVQKKEINYPEFLKRIASAGVETYEASLKDKNITYRGRRKFFIDPFVVVK